MMMSEIFRQLETRKLVVGCDAPNNARRLKIRQMAIGGTARDIGDGVGDVGDAEGATEGGEKFDNRLAPRGVALVDAAQVHFDQFVELLVRGVDMGVMGVAMRGASHRPRLSSFLTVSIVMRLSLNLRFSL